MFVCVRVCVFVLMVQLYVDICIHTYLYTVRPLYKGHFGTLIPVLITEFSSMQRSLNTLQYYTGTQNGVLIIEVSTFQSFLIEWFHCTMSCKYIHTYHMYSCIVCITVVHIHSTQVAPLVGLLTHMLTHRRSEESTRSACTALVAVTNDNEDLIQAVIDTGVCPVLLSLLDR